VLVVAALIGVAVTCGACSHAASPGINVHVVSGSRHSECLQLARYAVRADQHVLATHKKDTIANDQKEGTAYMAAVRVGAQQLSMSDPVRAQALRYAAGGLINAPFPLCNKEIIAVSLGRVPL
jgi:hypothetical protein